MRKVTYSTKPITFGEMILAQKVQNSNDYVALAELIKKRTDLSSSEILELDSEELAEVTAEVSNAITSAVTLTEIGKSLGD